MYGRDKGAENFYLSCLEVWMKSMRDEWETRRPARLEVRSLGRKMRSLLVYVLKDLVVLGLLFISILRTQWSFFSVPK